VLAGIYVPAFSFCFTFNVAFFFFLSHDSPLRVCVVSDKVKSYLLPAHFETLPLLLHLRC
jgi:hypothetical protein